MKFLILCSVGLWIHFTLSAKTFTLQEYGEILQTIEIIAKRSIEKKNYLPLVKELQRIPSVMTVSYVAQNKTIERQIYLTWLKTYIDGYISETDENGKKNIKIKDKETTKEYNKYFDNYNEITIPLSQKVQTLILTLQDMQDELAIMGYKSEDEQVIKNKISKLVENNFEKDQNTEQKSWLQERMEALLDWMENNFKGIKKIWNWFLVIILIAAIVFLVIQAKKYIKSSEKFVEETTHSGLLRPYDPRSSRELTTKAKKYEQEGNLRMAVRYYYTAFIILLEEKEILPYQPYFTNWEYYRKLTSMGFEQQEIHYLTALFDKTWYGMYSISFSEYQNYVLNYEKIQSILATAKT